MLFRSEDDGELGRLERTVDELEAAVARQLFVVVGGCLLHELLLLRWVRHDDDRGITMDRRVQDLVHDGDDFKGFVQHQHDVCEQDGIVTANHPLRLHEARLTRDLMGDGRRKGVLDVAYRGLSTVLQGTHDQDRVHGWL